MSSEFYGGVAIALTIVGYLLYFRGIIFYGTVPHGITWLIWALFAGIAFLGQLAGNGGAGAWSTGLGSFCCFIISAIGFARGSRGIGPMDVLCLATALCALALLQFATDPLLAVVVVTLADLSAMVPTIRKGWRRPRQETVSTFALTAVRHGFSILAMRERTLLTTLYPGVLIFSNAAFVLTVLCARRIKPPPAGRDPGGTEN